MTMAPFPAGRTIFQDKHCKLDFFNVTIEEITHAQRRFSGYLHALLPDSSSLVLFFLEAKPFNAAEIKGDRTSPIKVKQFFNRINLFMGEQTLLSLYETPVELLHSIVVYVQGEPTVKGNTRLLNLESLSDQIKSEKENVVVSLRKGDVLNFFPFSGGVASAAFFGDTDFSPPEDTDYSEQMLLYSFERHSEPIDVMVFGTNEGRAAQDAGTITCEEMLSIACGPDTTLLATGSGEQQSVGGRISLVAIDGPDKGRKIKVGLPAIIGRKDADIVLKNDTQISRRHAEVKVSEGKVVIEDLGSTNGTYLNGKEITDEMPISKGDTIATGESLLRVEETALISG